MDNRIYRDHDAYHSSIEKIRSAGRSIIFTNGCFDLLHAGHVQYLQHCKALNGFLIVGLNTDHSIRRLKGIHRPIQQEVDRAQILAGLRSVDMVILFNDDTPLSLIENINPDILVKGGDYNTLEIVGYDWVTQHGGKVMTIPLLEGRSSSSIIQKIKTLSK